MGKHCSVLRLAVALLTLLVLSPAATAAEVVLHYRDLVRQEAGYWAALGLELPVEDRSLPIIAGKSTEEGAVLLRRLDAKGGINGFAGVVYDNRDRGHSRMPVDLFPRLTHLGYGVELSAENADYGLAGVILLPAVVVGNSSTALRELPWRSLTRHAMTVPRGPVSAARLYAANHIYVYPEHRDYDEEDRFPANWPYTVTSQGSSRSDQPFLRAIAMTLAAFQKDTFAVLRDKGLVASTVQMIMRRNLAGVSNREDYLSSTAHPPVFDGTRLRSGRMVGQAAAMRPEDIPPMVRLRVTEEGFRAKAGLASLNERLFDTPAAIARIWRGFEWQRGMIVSAEDTVDPNDRPLTFEWRLLSGDPERVEIVPLGPDGRSARIHIVWHDPFTELVSAGTGEETRRLSRVDIGVFANNGVHDSAPAFLSVSFPAHQRRIYTADGSGAMRLSSVDYARARGAHYDPRLYWSAPWADTARYDAQGSLLGWDRTWSNGREAFFPDPSGSDVSAPRYRVDLSKRFPVLRIEKN